MQPIRSFPMLALSVCIIAACGGGSGGSASVNNTPAPAPTPAPTPTPTPDPDAAEKLAADLAGLSVDEFFDTASTALALRDPENVVFSGLAEEYNFDDIALTDISAAYRQETLEMYEVVDELLAQFDMTTLSNSQQISYQLFDWHIDNQIANAAFPHHDFIASHGTNTYLYFMQHPITSADDAEDFLARFALLDEKLAQLEINLEAARSAGIIEPGLSLQFRLQDMQYLADTAASEQPIYEFFVEALADVTSLTANQRASLGNELINIVDNQTRPAFASLAQTTDALLLSAPGQIGVDQYPQGAAFYQQRLNHHTTTDLGAEDIHQLGLQQLEQIHLQLDQAFALLGYPSDETLQQKFARAETDGGMVAPEDALATYQNLVDLANVQALDAFHSLPQTELVIVHGGGGYIPAPADGSGPAQYLAPLLNEQPYYLMPTLTYHEATPGHHYQIAKAQEAELPAFRQHLRFTGYVEGWGLYAERLAFEQGWYADDIWGNLGRLQFEAMRAARLVVDTGIHAKGWTFDQALDYYMEVTGFAQQQAEGHIFRYSVNVGQATAYMVGMLKILALREHVQQTQGDAFNLADFHDLIINNGAMPLATLETLVDQSEEF